MKKTLGLPASMATLIVSLCWPVHAVPISGKWAISASPFTTAVETELQLQGTPFGLSSRLGAVGVPYVTSSELGIEAQGNWWTTWGHVTHALSPHVSMGGLAGLSQSWFFRYPPIPFRNWYSIPQPLVSFVGVFYQQDWGRTRLRISPSISFMPPPHANAPAFDFWEASVFGPSLLEMGFRLDETSEFLLRTSLTPLAYTRSF